MLVVSSHTARKTLLGEVFNYIFSYSLLFKHFEQNIWFFIYPLSYVYWINSWTNKNAIHKYFPTEIITNTLGNKPKNTSFIYATITNLSVIGCCLLQLLIVYYRSQINLTSRCILKINYLNVIFLFACRINKENKLYIVFTFSVSLKKTKLLHSASKWG